MGIDLQNHFKDILNVDTRISQGNGKIYALRTAKYDNVKKIMDYLYKNSNIYFIRKHERYELMLKSRLNK